jgi:carbamoyl-phosphate synthase large subunit
MKILITGVGGVTPRSFAQALRKYSKYAIYELVATDSNPYALGLYMPQLFNKSYLVPKVTDPEYWNVLDRIIHTEKIEYAVINPELEVVEWARRSLEQTFPFKVLLPEYALASRLVDKAILSEALEPYGLVPKSFTITKEDAIDKTNLKLDYPFWIRSALGSSGLGSMKINSLEELRNWI